jgi:hypothetical protein
MLGRRQRKIIECLELGPISIEALMLRLGAHSRERRTRCIRRYGGSRIRERSG